MTDTAKLVEEIDDLVALQSSRPGMGMLVIADLVVINWPHVRSALAQSGNERAIPEGWKLVPVEPSAAMLEAAFHQANTNLESALGNSHCKTHEERSAHAITPIYAAMLSASPSPPASP